MSPDPLLEVRDLRTWFFTSDAGVVKAVDGVDLTLHRGEVVGLVGESGCGKSVTSMSILNLVDRPGRIVDGTVCFDGADLLTLPEKELLAVRGKRISMIFQQPVASLNPVHRVGRQIEEVYADAGVPRSERRDRAEEMLRRVGLGDAGRRARAYPHQLSGGQAQRAMIAMALAAGPELLIADEPTTALDVTIQAQILDLILELQADLGMAVLLVTHDLGVVAEVCDRVVVMYAGKVVEEADTRTLFAEPAHPYTRALIASIPVVGAAKDRLEVIPGRVPTLVDLGPECHFAPRCRARTEHDVVGCEHRRPALVEISPGHRVRCFVHGDAAEPDPVEVDLAVGRSRP